MTSEQRARALVANALAGITNPDWWIAAFAKELDEATADERQLRQDAQEALKTALEELAVQKNRAENHVETLKAIASMPPTDGERMRLWARDELSGCWPLESALLKVSDERNAAQAQLAGETARREKLESRCAELAAALAEAVDLLKPGRWTPPDGNVMDQPLVCPTCSRAEGTYAETINHEPTCPYPGIEAAAQGGSAVLAARDREVAARVCEHAADFWRERGREIEMLVMVSMAHQYRSGARQLPGGPVCGNRENPQPDVRTMDAHDRQVAARVLREIVKDGWKGDRYMCYLRDIADAYERGEREVPTCG